MIWLTQDIQLLAATAIVIGTVHTIMGPDHYLPFVAIARQRGWRLSRTLVWTAICGSGHCLASIALGVAGIALGLAVGQLELIQAVRGDLAAWLLLAFGMVILIVGLRRLARDRRHDHLHVHADGIAHSHSHDHHGDHQHVHESRPGGSLYWALFVVFLLGPCEALIPMLMYPAAQNNIPGIVLVTLAFTLTTLLTMLVMVTIAMKLTTKLGALDTGRWSGPASGAAIIGCAGAMLAGL